MTLAAGLAALCCGNAAIAMQNTTGDILQDYNQRFRNIGEQSDSNEQRISEWSTTLERLISDSRLTRAERASLELSVRCAVTQALDQENGWLSLNNADAYQAVENILDLDVVISETINTPIDQHYAWQAAQCLWDRHETFERMARASNVNSPHIGIGLENAALQTLNRAMTMYEISAASLEHLQPDNIVEHLQARGAVSARYFEYAIAARRLSGPFSNTQSILDRANAYMDDLLTDVRAFTGRPSQAWFTLKSNQVVGNLAYGASEEAANLAVELVEAATASGMSRQDATDAMIRLADQEARSTPTYLSHLNRLFVERGW